MHIQELLLGYWWIFLLIFIVGILILRQTAKIAVFLLGFILLVLVFWQIFISEAFRQANICFVEANQAQESDYAVLSRVNDEKERIELFCKQDEEVFTTLTRCLDRVSQKHQAGFFVYSHLPKFKTLIVDTVSTHNQACSETISYPN